MSRTYRCQYCGKEFDTQTGKNGHEVNCPRNTSSQTYPCRECSAEFPRPLDLARHVQNAHSGGVVHNDGNTVVEGSTVRATGFASAAVQYKNGIHLGTCDRCGSEDAPVIAARITETHHWRAVCHDCYQEYIEYPRIACRVCGEPMVKTGSRDGPYYGLSTHVGISHEIEWEQYLVDHRLNPCDGCGRPLDKTTLSRCYDCRVIEHDGTRTVRTEEDGDPDSDPEPESESSEVSD